MHMEHGSSVRHVLYDHFGGCLDLWFKLEEPPRAGMVAGFVDGKFFESLCTLVILINGIFAVFVANYEVANVGAEPSRMMKMCEYAFLGFYSLELFLKFCVHRCYFFCNADMKWNIFDLLLVGISVVDTAVSEMTSDSADSMDVTFLRALRLFKLAKILRMVRVMRYFAELRVMLNSVLGSFMSLFWAGVMLGLIYYIFGLLFVPWPEDGNPARFL